MHQKANEQLLYAWEDIRKDKEKELTEATELKKLEDEMDILEQELSDRIAANNGFIKNGEILESPTGKGY